MKALLRALSPARRWHLFVVIVMALFLARGLAYLATLPPFEGCDEYQHVAYLVHLEEHGVPPVFGDAVVSRRLLARLPEFPLPARSLEQMPGTTALGYDAFWRAPSTPTFDEKQPDIGLYQAQHGSLYYRLVAPVFAAAGGLDDLPRAIAWLRGINVLCVALAMWLVLWRVGHWVQARPVLGLVGLAVSLQPFFLAMACNVGNDAPSILAGVIAIFLITSRWRPSVAWAITVGLVIGGASLVKSVNLALVPFAAIWALVATYRATGGRDGAGASIWHRLGIAAVVVVSVLAVMAPTIWHNVETYGTPTSMQESIINKRAGHGVDSMLASARSIDWSLQFRELWTRASLWSGGWSELRVPRLIRHLYMYLLGMSFLGLLGTLLRRRGRDGGAWVAVLLVISFSAALAVHMIQTNLAWGGVATGPRYAGAVLPWLILGALAAAAGWGRAIQALFAFAFVVLFAVTEVRAFEGEMIPTFAATPFGSDALARIAMLQPAVLGSGTFWAAAGAAIALGLAAFGLALFGLIDGDSRSSGRGTGGGASA